MDTLPWFIFGVLTMLTSSFVLRVKYTKLTTRMEAVQPELMVVPAEIRNRLYRLALVSNELAPVDSGYHEPTLLSTRRKAGEEATLVYFLENCFRILLCDWDYTLWEDFFAHARWRGVANLKGMRFCVKINEAACHKKTALMKFPEFFTSPVSFQGSNISRVRHFSIRNLCIRRL